MNISRMLQIAVMMLVPATVFADKATTSVEVRYAGELTARRICKAVVQDDPVKLKRLLQQYRLTLPHAYLFKWNDKVVLASFTCNGMTLTAFSESMAARSVAYLLNPGAASAESVAAASAY